MDTPEKAAVREALEEGGVDVSVRSLIAVQNFISKKGRYHIIFVYLCNYVGGIPHPDGHETSDSVFMTESELDAARDECDPYCYWLAKRVFSNHYSEMPPEVDNPYGPMVGFY